MQRPSVVDRLIFGVTGANRQSRPAAASQVVGEQDEHVDDDKRQTVAKQVNVHVEHPVAGDEGCPGSKPEERVRQKHAQAGDRQFGLPRSGQSRPNAGTRREADP